MSTTAMTVKICIKANFSKKNDKRKEAQSEDSCSFKLYLYMNHRNKAHCTAKIPFTITVFFCTTDPSEQPDMI